MSQNITLPPVSVLFPDPGTAHADFLDLVGGVLEDLAAEGITPDPHEFLLRSSQAWEIYRQYAPEL